MAAEVDSPSPRVSVIMAARNARATIQGAVDSVMAQSVRDLELIVVDDASTDGSVDALGDGIAESRVRTIRLDKNVGAAEARNVALNAARADLVAILDADDLMAPARLQVQLSLMSSRSELALVTGSHRTFGDGVLPVVNTPPTHHDAIAMSLQWGPTFAHGTVMLSREAALRVGGYRGEYEGAEDYDLYGRLLAAGYRFGGVSDVVLHYRLSATGLSSTMRDVVSRRHAAISFAIRSDLRSRGWQEPIGVIRLEAKQGSRASELRVGRLVARELVRSARGREVSSVLRRLIQLGVAGPWLWVRLARELPTQVIRWRRRTVTAAEFNRHVAAERDGAQSR